MTEPHYTLAEARTELARQECLTSGHVFDELKTLASQDPYALHCTRCGQRCSSHGHTDCYPLEKR